MTTSRVLQPAQGRGRLGGGLPQIVAQPFVERFQPFGDGALQFALALGLALDRLGKTPGDFALRGRQVPQLGFPNQALAAVPHLPLPLGAPQACADAHQRGDREPQARQYGRNRQANPNFHRPCPILVRYP